MKKMLTLQFVKCCLKKQETKDSLTDSKTKYKKNNLIIGTIEQMKKNPPIYKVDGVGKTFKSLEN